MRIKSSTITFWFNKQENVKEYSKKLNDILKNDFLPFIEYDVPTKFDYLYPRMTTTSKTNGSRIEMSLINLRINTLYDEIVKNDINYSIDYLKEKTIMVYNALKMCGINIVYSAIFIVLDEKNDNPSNYIINKYCNKKAFNNINEIGIRLSTIVDNKYYKIIFIGSRNFEINLKEIKKLINSNQVIKIKDKTKLAIDLEKIAKENSLKGIFIRDLHEKIKENPEGKEKILKIIEIGIEAMDA